MMKLVLIALMVIIISATAASCKESRRRLYIARISTGQVPSSSRYTTTITETTHRPIYNYSAALNGFAISLSRDEAATLAKQPGVISVTPDRAYSLDTTRSPAFLGLAAGHFASSNIHPLPNIQTDHLVIGVIDSGVWPEHPSFNDTGLGPLPPTWKGACDEGDNFTASHCNNKLIGARYFFEGYARKIGPPPEKSARDHGGHGTHTATTAAGSLVQNANMFGLAPGVARGMAPDARIAAYKVCWRTRKGCYSSDILAGIDAAINDGVDVISISLGRDRKYNYYDDMIAVGAYSAMTKGIFVTLSAGNSGPGRGTVTNVAPWITTVGASSLDREFPINVTLGNGYNYTGVSFYNDDEENMKSPAPLVYNGKCETQLDPKLVMGKIVVCDQDRPEQSPWTTKTSMDVKTAGGIGLISINTKSEEIYPAAFFLPTAVMGREAGKAIRSYMDLDPNPTALISNAITELDVQPAPTMPSFSSRGPNIITPEILKPDLTAPGVSIIAAWTADGGPTFYDYDKRRVSFNIASGTSMSCPHVSGLALLLKGAHPEWSPAVIRSALMTTAYTTFGDDDDRTRTPIIDRATVSPATPYDYGSGHVDPVAALDPGLVYDLTEQDYLSFLCALSYTPLQIKKVTGTDFSCDPRKDYSLGDFNYPSFSVVLRWPSSPNKTTTYRRTLTNVGPPTSTYTVSLSLDSNAVNATVEPCSLTFTQVNEKQSYSVTFVTTHPPRLFGTIFGSLEWSDGRHKVRSPIVITQKY